MGSVQLSTEQVRQQHPLIYDIFFKGGTQPMPQKKEEVNENPRKEGESLHDYFTRKGMKCFCNDCRQKSKQK